MARGRLPAGLSLAADGTVSGAATMPGVFDFTVQSTSSQGHRNVRRYSITPLVACLKNIGWDCVGNFPFGQDFGRPCGMLVFQRRLRLQ